MKRLDGKPFMGAELNALKKISGANEPDKIGVLLENIKHLNIEGVQWLFNSLQQSSDYYDQMLFVLKLRAMQKVQAKFGHAQRHPFEGKYNSAYFAKQLQRIADITQVDFQAGGHQNASFQERVFHSLNMRRTTLTAYQSNLQTQLRSLRGNEAAREREKIQTKQRHKREAAAMARQTQHDLRAVGEAFENFGVAIGGACEEVVENVDDTIDKASSDKNSAQLKRKLTTLAAAGLTRETKRRAVQAVREHIPKMNIEAIRELFNQLQTRGQFDFVREERGGMYRMFSPHGRTDSYRECLHYIQENLMNRFFLNHVPNVTKSNVASLSFDQKLEALMHTRQFENSENISDELYNQIGPIMKAPFMRVGLPSPQALKFIQVLGVLWAREYPQARVSVGCR